MGWVAWSDARAAFRLLHEVQELGAEPRAWRIHLLTGLSSLVQAKVALGGEAPGARLLDASRHQGSLDVGWATASDRATWMGVCTRTEPAVDPCDARIAEVERETFTRPRPELATDRSWYRSIVFNDHYRPARLGDHLVSSVVIPGRCVSHYLMLFRDSTDRGFDDGACSLVHHVHTELAQLWAAEGAVALPRRLHRVLALVRQGLAEKEIAAALELSPHTVREYCKALHRRYGAHSRTELLARAAAVPPPPRLAVDSE